MSAESRVERDLTVVIPTLGRPVLRRSLDALANGILRPGRVLVVDQGRSSEIEAIVGEFAARGLAVEWIPSKLRGRAAGLNRGIERVATRYFAVTDDDCLVSTDWTQRMIARLRAEEGAIVTGRVEAGEGGVQLSVVTVRREVVQRRPGLRFDRLSGGNMGMATETARRVGAFDEDECMRTAEDAEYAYRALRAGVAIVYAPEVVVHHLGWRAEEERVEQYLDYARSQGGFLGKYLRRGDLFIALRATVQLARALRRWALASLRGDREMARNGRAYATGLLPGILAGWRSGSP